MEAAWNSEEILTSSAGFTSFKQKDAYTSRPLYESLPIAQKYATNLQAYP